MDVRFRSAKLHESCCRPSELIRAWGERGASALTRTLSELLALERLGDMESLPYVSVDRDSDGGLALESSDGVRLRLLARSGAGRPLKSWKAADCVVVVEVEVAKT